MLPLRSAAGESSAGSTDSARSSMTKRLICLPGDGIGGEIIRQAQRVLEWFNRFMGREYQWRDEPIGGAALDAVGTPLPAETLAACKRADAVLLGSVGGEKWETADFRLRPESGLLALRKGLGLFANLRPAKVYEGFADASSLKPQHIRGLDMVVVRELTGGIYFGEPRGIMRKNGERRGVNTLVYDETEIRRVARLAFSLAMGRSKRVCSVDKANVLEATMLWREVVSETAEEFPQIELSHMYVDNAAMQLISAPSQFDVMVTTNMFGDILSDAAAAVVGSLGLLPSASVADGGNFGLYEPVHGSAPDIAGQNKANPTAMILSLAMAFRISLGDGEAAAMLERAVADVLAAGARTADILGDSGGEPLTTEQMTTAIINRLDELTAENA